MFCGLSEYFLTCEFEEMGMVKELWEEVPSLELEEECPVSERYRAFDSGCFEELEQGWAPRFLLRPYSGFAVPLARWQEGLQTGTLLSYTSILPGAWKYRSSQAGWQCSPLMRQKTPGCSPHPILLLLPLFLDHFHVPFGPLPLRSHPVQLGRYKGFHLSQSMLLKRLKITKSKLKEGTAQAEKVCSLLASPSGRAHCFNSICCTFSMSKQQWRKNKNKGRTCTPGMPDSSVKTGFGPGTGASGLFMIAKGLSFFTSNDLSWKRAASWTVK